mmetsp:Transcript_4596/g.6183  ORF Transcript_4596/g.6183 Transcript_4596/m.6183 type:complete len:171 (+) Transcript_4596:303-815(+)|eukprot:CAMPEP_0196598384 /NCGR_PEP_ID=MMETSP1081-20130531/94289_1 /TAXON_ID=36882 /ORGANISM="Pyramimonas amylifera, Strain CCMP720" /LENGTH=170 /DNA_ID=CAMNT_0041924071 /DNA_START=948 /DNA_END=1460 /DNA_ORIENTATION=-
MGEEGKEPTSNEAQALTLQLEMMTCVRRQEYSHATVLIQKVLALDPGNKLCGEMQEVLLQKIALDEESSEEEQEEDGEGESESEEDVEEGVEEGMQGLNLQDPEGEEGSEPDSNSGSDSDSDQEATEPIQYATEAPSTIPPPALVKVMQQLLEEDKANPQNNPPTSSTWK